MRVTINMVAEAAGVSRGTVDRVINKRGRVKPEVEQRVLDAIKEMNYMPNKIASALSYSRTIKTIGVVCCDSGKHFVESIQKGIEQGISDVIDFGINVRVEHCGVDDVEGCLEKIDILVNEGCNAIAMGGLTDKRIEARINELAENGIPTVVFNSDVPNCKKLCFVGQDLYRSGKVAGDIIAKLLKPEKRIAIIANNPKSHAANERIYGFIYKMKQYNIDESRWIIARTEKTYEKTYNALETIFMENDDIGGIYMVNESDSACGKFLSEHGFTEKPVVVCHDASVDAVYYTKAGVIDYVIEQDIAEQGHMAILILKDYIRFGILPPSEKIISDLNIKNMDCFM